MARFIPGLELGRLFYRDVVKPILEQEFPQFHHSAGLIGPGSEVLGFDTEMSTDHDWGPRVMIFHTRDDYDQCNLISKRLADILPAEFMGIPTNFTKPELLEPLKEGPVNHRVEFLELNGFFEQYLGYDVTREPELSDWLSFPMQRLRSVVSGYVFHDELGLNSVRSGLAWYPKNVWIYLLACLWKRIGQDEHLMARAAFVDDEIGWRIIAARLSRDLMRLAFLMERQYPPYAKWFGTAFNLLDAARTLGPQIQDFLCAATFNEGEKSYLAACEVMARCHNALAITEPMDPSRRHFHSRPFRVIDGQRFCDALLAEVEDGTIRSMDPIGSIDLVSDNTDVLQRIAIGRTLFGHPA